MRPMVPPWGIDPPRRPGGGMRRRRARGTLPVMRLPAVLAAAALAAGLLGALGGCAAGPPAAAPARPTATATATAAPARDLVGTTWTVREAAGAAAGTALHVGGTALTVTA